MKTGLMSLLLFLSLQYISCTPSKKMQNDSLPFVNIEWRLLHGNLNDSNINFSSSPDSSLVVKFNNRKFRGYDGGFNIYGTSRDTGSHYHTSTPYAGFYHLKDSSQIGFYWFPNISWSMDFRKHEMGKIIGKLFGFEGKYDYKVDSLIFYKENKEKKDTVFVLKRIDPDVVH